MTEQSKFLKWHDKNYKLLLVIPLILIIISAIYMINFYYQNNDFIKRDVSLSEGTSITVNIKTDISVLEKEMTEILGDVSVRTISDLRTGEQIAFVMETKASPEQTKSALEDFLNIELTNENSSVEFTGSTLGENFYKQLILAILYAFIFMGAVVFYIFGTNRKIKILIISLALLNPFLFFVLRLFTVENAILSVILTLLISFYFYIRYSIPSLAVITSALADILMTVVLVNILGFQISAAGIVAFLMLIGYSVDTDILLTTRLIRRKDKYLNERLKDAFKTGITMTLTSIAAILIALIITMSFSKTLEQIFTVLLIGLGFDILNTWITNASLLKWYCKTKKIE
jgi:preprotein translocase subunit SecF